MTNEKLVLLKEIALKNNCPECYNQNIVLSFYQKHKSGKFYYSITKTIENKISCNKCGSTIYPAKWTDNIERLFDYYKKLAKPEKSSFRLKPLFWVLLVLLFAAAGVCAYLFNEGFILF